jgi:hypothetical protein
MPASATSKLLINESPLIILPSLAAALGGVEEALFLQQVHYWLTVAGHERDGCKWIYNSYPDWQAQLPFWSTDTIRRIVGKLKGRGILRTSQQYNRLAVDRTNWYTIDYDALNALLGPSGEDAAPGDESAALSGEDAALSGEDAALSGEDAALSGEDAALSGESAAPLPEITSESIAEINTEGGSVGPPPPLLESFTVTDELCDWAEEQIVGAGLPAHAVNVGEETARWYDAPRPRTAADWRTWMRRAISWAIALPQEWKHHEQLRETRPGPAPTAAPPDNRAIWDGLAARLQTLPGVAVAPPGEARCPPV